MTAITWTISALDCKPQEGSFTNVVTTVHWACTGTQSTNGKTYTGTVYSTCSLAQPGNPFIQYPSLTKDTVLSWIWASGVDRAATEAAVQQQINSQINPAIITPPLPWVA